MHYFLSVPARPYDPEQRLLGCCGELHLEGLPANTEITMASFAARRVISAVLLEYHILHVEGVSVSIWWMTPCERASGEAEGRNLSFQGVNYCNNHYAIIAIIA